MNVKRKLLNQNKADKWKHKHSIDMADDDDDDVDGTVPRSVALTVFRHFLHLDDKCSRIQLLGIYTYIDVNIYIYIQTFCPPQFVWTCSQLVAVKGGADGGGGGGRGCAWHTPRQRGYRATLLTVCSACIYTQLYIKESSCLICRRFVFAFEEVGGGGLRTFSYCHLTLPLPGGGRTFPSCSCWWWWWRG